VNSGKFTGGKNLDDTIVKTNIEAAAEIARQVRLRDIGGIIVCDFIDMSSESDRNKVIKSLEDGLRKDRTRSTIQSFSPLGLLEFTRKRVGKDLAGQLRATCPMCSGLGSVMSPESVTISTFRQIAQHKNGHAEHVHVAASPQVAAQIEFWYEEELRTLAERVNTPIDVRVDPAVHPETPLVVWGPGLPELPPVRVGDEFEVELLASRLPTATSAAAVVNGRLIEVENAANAAGNAIKIRIIDVDGADILAEPRFPIGTGSGAAAIGAGDGKKRRRRGGRGRKPLTVAEQQEELRELAEEAAKGIGARPVPVIGISTTEEAVAEEQVARNEGAPKHVTPAVASDVEDLLADALDAPSVHPPRGRGRGGRGSRGSEAPPTRQPVPPPFRPAPPPSGGGLAPLPGESLSGALVAKLPGETLSGDRVNELVTPPPPVRERPVPVPAAAAPYQAPESDEADTAPGDAEAGDQPGRKRRRRRRRGRGNGNGVAGETGAVAPATAGVYLDAEDDESPEPIIAAAAPSSGVPETLIENDGRKRRRRRRRRRGANGAATGVLGVPGTLPDRHIIRVDGEGGAQPTGENAPPQPNRALAPWNRRKKGEIAIEPPPPSLTAPPEEVHVTAPSRRRAPARPAAAGRGGRTASIEAVEIKALPAPARKKASATAGAAKKTSTRTTSAKKTAEPKAAAKKSVAKKSVAKKSSAVKSTAAKKSTATAKKTPARKATSAKKTVRKKT
jgi:Ribonuclease E/G family